MKLLQGLLLLPLFVLGACTGGGDSAKGNDGPTKPINSVWVKDGNNFTLDLRAITVGNTHSLDYTNGCNTDVSFRGNLFAGIYSQTVVNNNCALSNGTNLYGAFAIDENNVLHLVITHMNGTLLEPELIEIYR